MILPTVYLESSVTEKTVEDFILNLAETTISEWPLHLFVEKGAEPIADKILPALKDVGPAVHQHPLMELGRNKAFKAVAFQMQQHGKGWLYLEPSLVTFNEEGWLQKLGIEYGSKLLSAGTLGHFLGAQFKFEDGPMSPLCGVWPANLYEQSIMLKHPDKTPEQDMRWEVRLIARISEVIGTSDKFPVTAKLGK